MMAFLQRAARFSASFIAAFVLAAPAWAGNDHPRCPQRNIDYESYLRAIESKPLAAMDPFEVLFIQNHEQKLAKSSTTDLTSTVAAALSIAACWGWRQRSASWTTSRHSLLAAPSSNRPKAQEGNRP